MPSSAPQIPRMKGGLQVSFWSMAAAAKCTCSKASRILYPTVGNLLSALFPRADSLQGAFHTKIRRMKKRRSATAGTECVFTLRLLIALAVRELAAQERNDLRVSKAAIPLLKFFLLSQTLITEDEWDQFVFDDALHQKSHKFGARHAAAVRSLLKILNFQRNYDVLDRHPITYLAQFLLTESSRSLLRIGSRRDLGCQTWGNLEIRFLGPDLKN